MAEGETADTADAAEVPAPEPGAIVSDDVRDLLARVEAALGDAVVASAESYGTLVVRVKPESWRRAAEVAKHALECDYLSFLSGIDWLPSPKEGGDEGSSDTSSPVQPSEQTPGLGGAEGRFQVFAHVESTRHRYGFTLKTDVSDTDPAIDSWVPVYAGADWHERETWEMYGIDFPGHPGVRHLYLPYEFEGYPLRKDFPLLARTVKPWPGLVDVEGMPGEDGGEEAAE